MNKLFKKVVGKDNVGWGFIPELPEAPFASSRHIYLGRSLFLYYHLPRQAAFTLAEVLITLGIIGVVAALTLPALIQKYQKIVTVNRLKTNVSILSNAIRMSEAHNGEIAEWDLVSNARQDYDPDSSTSNDLKSELAKQYIMPYLKGELTLTKTLAQLGYTTPISYPNYSSSVFAPLTAAGTVIRLNNGSIVLLNMDWGTNPLTGNRSMRGLQFYIDIDGPKGKNTIGKDIFVAELPFAYKTKFMMYEYWTLTGGTSATMNKIEVSAKSRDDLMQQCKEDTYGQSCGRLIEFDGWEIKDDYPWW